MRFALVVGKEAVASLKGVVNYIFLIIMKYISAFIKIEYYYYYLARVAESTVLRPKERQVVAYWENLSGSLINTRHCWEVSLLAMVPFKALSV